MGLGGDVILKENKWEAIYLADVNQKKINKNILEKGENFIFLKIKKKENL